ncbi:hypothetical protein Q3G72_009740 [Acer saccharum]|nr:hypothetical protein Q3G72_009740 [Acer saccharum]
MNAGTEEEYDSKELKSKYSLCVWDETAHLFFHARLMIVTDNPVQDGLSEQVYCYDENHASVHPGHKECTRNQTPENPPPPSE